MIPPWFESELVTRGTEIDTAATVGMPVFMRYFEHLRWRLMAEEVLGLRPLIDRGHFYVVRSQTLELRQRVGQEVRMHVRTRIMSVGRSTTQVLHEARDVHDGSLIARARVVGAWLGPDRRLARLPDAFREAGAAQRAHHVAEVAALLPDAHDESLGDPARDEPARIVAVRGGQASSFIDPPRVVFGPLSLAVDAPSAPPTRIAFEHFITVPPRDLDVFSHLNAATWLTYADDARHFAAAHGALDADVASGYTNRVAVFYGREASRQDPLRVALAPVGGALGETHALGAWFYRGDEAEPVCTLRVDLAPGAHAVTAPQSTGA